MILDLAGVGVPDAVRGSSLVPQLRGTGPEREAILSEYDEEIGRVFARTVVTKEWKITCYGGQPYGELFDLRGLLLEEMLRSTSLCEHRPVKYA